MPKAASTRTRTSSRTSNRTSSPASTSLAEPVSQATHEPAVRPKPRSTRSRSARSRAVVPVALGSLTQPGARQGTVCQACSSPRVTSLALTLTDGTPVEFTSCHNCEHRTWFSPTGELDRATVLEKTRKIR